MEDMESFSFENIIAWQKAHLFTRYVYDMTKHFPEDERYGLVSQFRRAAVSIGANIAEGMKSMAYSLTFQNPNDNLTDEEVTKYMDKITKVLVEQLGAEVR